MSTFVNTSEVKFLFATESTCGEMGYKRENAEDASVKPATWSVLPGQSPGGWEQADAEFRMILRETALEDCNWTALEDSGGRLLESLVLDW